MEDRKTLQEAFTDLKSEIIKCIPDWFYPASKFINKYRVSVIIFQVLSVYMLYIEEYPSAIIAVIISFYFLKR